MLSLNAYFHDDYFVIGNQVELSLRLLSCHVIFSLNIQHPTPNVAFDGRAILSRCLLFLTLYSIWLLLSVKHTIREKFAITNHSGFSRKRFIPKCCKYWGNLSGFFPPVSTYKNYMPKKSIRHVELVYIWLLYKRR